MNISTQTTTASGSTTRLPTSSLEPATAARVTRPTESSTPADSTTNTSSQEPVLRFPWLNRVSRELETVAKQKPPFTSATPLGDHLDSSA